MAEPKIRIKETEKNFNLINMVNVTSLGRNPRRGGSPPSERKRIISHGFWAILKKDREFD